MTNRITHIEVRNRSLTPAEAEIWITVHAETPNATTEVHGRLMGPNCPYSSTVEVAYPLRSFHGAPPLTRRVVIPEPSLWEPESPFLYQGPIELWQDGQVCDRVTVRHGLCSSSLTSRGLRWNGKLLPLRGRAVRRLTNDNAMSLRQSGVNLLLATLQEMETWSLADRFGFLVLGELPQLDNDAFANIEQLSTHPSCLGWLLDVAAADKLVATHRERLGVVATSSETIPAWAAFVVCPSDQAALFADSNLPLLVRGEVSAIASPIFGCIL